MLVPKIQASRLGNDCSIREKMVESDRQRQGRSVFTAIAGVPSPRVAGA
jgi:hypothetical protein